MRVVKWFPQLAPVLALVWIVGLIAAPPQVVSAPLVQSEVTPRPTVPPTPTVGPAPTTGPGPTGPETRRGGASASQIDLFLAVDKTEAHAGDPLRYQLQVANVEGREATNVWLTCDLPADIAVEEVKSSQGEIHNYGQRISVDLGRLPPSFESQSVSIVARILDSAQPGSELIHHANLTSDQAGGAERSVQTLVLGAAPTAAAESAGAGMLPTTGSGSMPWWAVAGFCVLIVAAAVASMRKRIRGSHRI